jgi:hypothetical protein
MQQFDIFWVKMRNLDPSYVSHKNVRQYVSKHLVFICEIERGGGEGGLLFAQNSFPKNRKESFRSTCIMD